MTTERRFPIIPSRKYGKPHPTHVPWSIADEAYSVYSARYGTRQSLEGLAERGGFAPEEMDAFRPGWIEAASEVSRLRAALETIAFLANDSDPAIAQTARKALAPSDPPPPKEGK